MRPAETWYEEAERVLKALANVNRLRLLEILQAPRGYAELTLPPSRGKREEDKQRIISRQALHQHLRALTRLGLVQKVAVPERTEPHYVVNRARLWSELERLRRLARVRPEVELPLPVEDVPPPYRIEQAGPHLVLIRGADEGRVFPLPAAGESSVGRARGSAVCLDYDAGVSPSHARIGAEGGAYEIKDLGSHNGTYLNWRRLRPDAALPLSHGDVIGAGGSLLLFRAG